MLTNEYKNNLLKYLTGNIEIQTGKNEPVFLNQFTKQNNLKDFIVNELGNNAKINGYIQIDNNNDIQNSKIVLYGEYGTNGFILICNYKGMPEIILKQYESGTLFGQIKYLFIEEDTKISGIENTTNGTKLILLNNFLIKIKDKYVVKLQYSVFLPENLQSLTNYTVKKDINSSKYLIVAKSDENIVITVQTFIFEVTINVGSENEWKEYTYNKQMIKGFDYYDVFAIWNESNEIFFNITGITSEENAKFISLRSENGSLTLKAVTYDDFIDLSTKIHISISSINENKIYFATTVFKTTVTGENIEEYTINFYNGEKIEQIFIQRGIQNENPPYIISGIELKNINNEIFFELVENTTIEGNIKNIYFGKIIEDKAYLSEGIINITTNIFDFLFIVKKQYNLYNFYGQFDNTVYQIQQVYNSFNYNGLKFNNGNSLNSQSVILEDKNKEIIFARNLYDKIVQQNITNSIVQINNTLLNEIEISSQKLLSKNNNIINDETLKINKNIFEELYINFINELMIENQNKMPFVKNISATNKLNKSINTENDYNNAKMSKYRLNYMDNSSEITKLDNSSIEYNNNIAKIKITVYNANNKSINNLELISEDEKISYLTIDLSNLEKDKYFEILQEVEVL